MDKRPRSIAAVLAAALALLIVEAVPALSDDEAPEETAARTERPTSLNRPIGLKPYFLSPPPDTLAPSDDQRARRLSPVSPMEVIEKCQRSVGVAFLLAPLLLFPALLARNEIDSYNFHLAQDILKKSFPA